MRRGEKKRWRVGMYGYICLYGIEFTEVCSYEVTGILSCDANAAEKVFC
jgi:hypothetical protein